MRLNWILLLIVFILSDVESQTWFTGDNSTVIGCSTHCSLDDHNLSCWNSTLNFFSKVLIGQLRHYITVQVDIDQWHRRHGESKGQDMELVALEIEKAFLNELKPKDILHSSTVIRVAKAVSDRIRNVSDHVISWTPHFQCPIPCEYRHNSYRNLFIASMVLNVCLLMAVIPFMVRFIRHDGVWNSQSRLIGS